MVKKPSQTVQPQPRLWHVTVTWTGRGKRLKRDFILSAFTKEEADEMVQNRIFSPTSKSDKPDTRCRDLGPIQARRTYFSSDITPVNPFGAAEQSPIEELVLQFTMKWGAEIGWRSTNQGASDKDLVILEKLKNEKNRTNLLYEWATEYIEHPTQDPDQFIANKLSTYLGTQVTNLSDMIPVSDTEYSHIMKNAQQQAANIVAEAKKSADEIRSQLNTETARLAEIAKALNKQIGVPPVATIDETSIETTIEEKFEPITEQNVEPENTDTTDDFIDIEPTEDETSDEEQFDDNTVIDDIEEPSDIETNTEDTQSDDNLITSDDDLDIINAAIVSSQATSSVESELPEPVQTISDDDLNALFPDDDDDEDDDDYVSYEEDIPEDEIFDEDDMPDFEFQIEDLDEMMDEPDFTDEQPAQPTQSFTQRTAVPKLTDDDLAKELHNFKIEVLMPYLSVLQLTQKARDGHLTTGPANKVFNFRCAHITDETEKIDAIIQCIQMCKPINNKSATRYVYDKLRSEMSDDEVIE